MLHNIVPLSKHAANLMNAFRVSRASEQFHRNLPGHAIEEALWGSVAMGPPLPHQSKVPRRSRPSSDQKPFLSGARSVPRPQNRNHPERNGRGCGLDRPVLPRARVLLLAALNGARWGAVMRPPESTTCARAVVTRPGEQLHDPRTEGPRRFAAAPPFSPPPPTRQDAGNGGGVRGGH